MTAEKKTETNSPVKTCRDSWVQVKQTDPINVPVQLRPGVDDGDVQILIHHGGYPGTATMVEVSIADLELGLDLTARLT